MDPTTCIPLGLGGGKVFGFGTENILGSVRQEFFTTNCKTSKFSEAKVLKFLINSLLVITFWAWFSKITRYNLILTTYQGQAKMYSRIICIFTGLSCASFEKQRHLSIDMY